MKYCIKCGAMLQDNAIFCDKCGTKIEENIQETDTGDISSILHKALTSNFLFSFNGRLNRAPYTVLLLIFVGITTLFSKVNIPVMCIAIDMILFIPSVSINVRRLHDLNLSGWYLFLPIGITFGCFFIMGFLSSISGLLVSIAILSNIIFSIIAIFVKGTSGPNKYGNDLLPIEKE